MRLHELEAELRAGRKARRANTVPGGCMRFEDDRFVHNNDITGEVFVGLTASAIFADDWELVPEPQRDPEQEAFENESAMLFGSKSDSPQMRSDLARYWHKIGWSNHAALVFKVNADRLYSKWCHDSGDWPDEPHSQQANSFKAGVAAALAEMGK